MSEENENSGEGGGIASLRKQYEELTSKLAERDARLAKFEAQERQSAVAQALKAKGLPEKAASLYSGEDVSEEAVGKWAAEYADIFGAQSQQNDSSQQVVDPNVASAQRVSDASHGTETTVNQKPVAGGMPVGDPNELLHKMKTLPYEELVKQNLLPDVTGTLYGNPTRR